MQIELPIRLDASCEAKIVNWLKSGRKVAVWQNKDLGNPAIGNLSFTPGDSQSPHWNCGKIPELITDNPQNFAVETVKSLGKGKLKHGKPYQGGFVKSKALQALLDSEKDTFFIPDYSSREYGNAWFFAEAFAVIGTRPLAM